MINAKEVLSKGCMLLSNVEEIHKEAKIHQELVYIGII